ncbi:MAG: hypothetical protein JWO53_989, partial [Chlamydiia bacterium]|nr:hypothetical protein [Chlamydiia bacterium]
TDEKILKCPEISASSGKSKAGRAVVFALAYSISKTAAAVFLTLSVASILVGVCVKAIALKWKPELQAKYSFKTLLYARTQQNFSGKLPARPFTPNCVNSQKDSLWGAIYNVKPIAVSEKITQPLIELKKILATCVPDMPSNALTLVEEQGSYLHYKGVVTGKPSESEFDIDVFYNKNKKQFDIRSASRSGFVDSETLDFKEPGSNKKRVEAIRQEWMKRAIEVEGTTVQEKAQRRTQAAHQGAVRSQAETGLRMLFSEDESQA